jgi:predicted DNA-binding transcriptional regulator AlpA
MAPATYTAEEFAQLLGVSSWAIYSSAKDGTCPIAPIRVGRRLVWSRAAVDRLLGVNEQQPPEQP